MSVLDKSRSRIAYAALALAILLVGTAIAQGTVQLPEPSAGALVAQRDRQLVWVLQQVVAIMLALILLSTGLGARITRSFQRVLPGRWAFTAVSFSALCALLFVLVQTPLDFLLAVRREAWGVAPTPIADFVQSQLSILIRTMVLAGGLGLLVFLMIRSSPRWWHFWSTGLLLLGLFLYLTVRPILLDPISQTSYPLRDAQWASRFSDLSSRVGLAHVPVFVQETSPDAFCRVSGSVFGFGPTLRVGLLDGVFSEFSDAEIEAIFAHELKHYLFDNSWKLVMVLAVLFAGGALTVYALTRTALGRWSDPFGFSALREPASLPLIVLSVHLYLLVTLPILNLVNQHIELEADRFALELTRNNVAVMATQSAVCGRLWTTEAGLIEKLYLRSHPSLGDRLRLSASYRPWETNEVLAYDRYIVD